MRTVLFLINGFGIESKDSYTVYNASLMPNFDKLLNKYMFSKIDSGVRNVYDGYRNMSLETNGLYNYKIYSREAINGNLLKNNTLLTVSKTLIERKSKLHLLCFVDTSLDIVENLKYFLTTINKERDKKIFLHIVLTSNNYEDYPKILEVLSKINVDLNDYATIGMVMGLANLLNSNKPTELNFFLKTMISEIGERWTSFKQKLDVSFGTKQAPSTVKPFVVNNGFGIKNDDMFLIWNYDNVDLTNYIDAVRMINYGDKANVITFFSLFPLTYKEQIPFMLNYEVAKNSLATNMKGLGFTSLVICERDEINGINYYLNGLQMVNNPSIAYICLDERKYDPATILSVINGYKQDFIIINYDISKTSNIEELNNTLSKIDTVLGALYDNTEKNSYNIVVSSTYGMHKTLNNTASGEICNIDYVKVPIIYIDNFVTKRNYLINDGDISALFRVCYKSMKKEYPGISLVTKKNLLYRLIFK